MRLPRKARARSASLRRHWPHAADGVQARSNMVAGSSSLGSRSRILPPVSWIICAVMVGAVGAGGAAAAAADQDVLTHIDSMFKTSNTTWNCMDGGPSPNGNHCQTDNAGLTWSVESSLAGTTGHSRIANQLNTEFAPTDLTVTFQLNPVYTGGSETDIIYQQGPVSGADARTWCDDAVTTVKCDQHYVRFRSTVFGFGLACHESGHAIGLSHGAESSPQQSNNYQFFYCMRLPAANEGLGPDVGTIRSQIDATY